MLLVFNTVLSMHEINDIYYCRPNSKVYKKTLVFFQKNSKKLSIKSQLSTLILICFI